MYSQARQAEVQLRVSADSKTPAPCNVLTTDSKFVDSHLKPYRCKVASCSAAKFSSTACRLRHEREAHGLHGHGDKPYSCNYTGCERSLPGNGFPRQWNLKDHMKRVHNDTGCPDVSPPPAAQPQTKSRKRKTDLPEAKVISTRKTTVKSMPASTSQRLSIKPLIEEWMSHRQAVESILRSGLNKPDDVGNISQIHAMQERLSAMAQMSTDMHASSRPDIMPAPRARTYTSTG